MTIRTVFFIFFFGMMHQLCAKDPMYPVAAIPDSLLVGADMVIRESSTVFTIVAKDEARYKIKKALTILNDQGKQYALGHIFYDELTKVVEFSGNVYDAKGELIRKLKKSDIHDRSFVSGFSLYEDTRVQFADLSHGKYPYTVAFEYEVKYKYLFQVPSFALLPGERVSLQQASFSLRFPPDLAPKFKTINLSKDPLAEKDKAGNESLSWTFTGAKHIKPEPYGLSFDEIVPKIMVAPIEFEYEGYYGRMDSWENFGVWISTLNEGRDILDEETKLKIRQLTEGIKSKKEKVRKLYEYMQNSTRYVSIQLGIGGFQPFEASVVDRTGYGDCKALSNYMIAMLKVIGIEGRYVLIRAGENAGAIQTDFPSAQFNHVIVAVPDATDTLWLECTSQTNPFGYLGSFTDDRYALMILESGSRLVKTPAYKGIDNTQFRIANVFLSLNGEGKAEISTAYSGLQYENGDLHFILNQQDEQKKWILNNTDIPNFNLKNFSVSSTKDAVPTAEVKLEVTIPSLGAANGKRIFLTPNLMNRIKFVPETNENRKAGVIVNVAWTDIDTINYHVPEAIYPEFVPQPVRIESIFGSYESDCRLEQGVLVYTRKLKVVKGRFSAKHYGELVDFYRDIKKADESKIVFLNET